MRTPPLRRPPLAAALLVLALAPAAAAQPAPVKLERKLGPGSRARVVETVRQETRFRYKDRGTAVGDAELAVAERAYVEEVRTAQPELLHRAFERSTRGKGRPPTEPASQPTSVHGRGLLVAGLEQSPDGPFEVSKDDREALRFDRLVAALLVDRPVARGEAWTVPKEPLVQALFGQFVAAASAEGAARVELKQLKAERGVTRATLKARIQLVLTKTDSFPGLSLQLQGDVVWGVEAGRCLEARLEGPLTFAADAGEGGVQAEGSLVWTLRAEVLEARAAPSEAERTTGLPPPPGTQALVCEKDPAHRFNLGEFVRCIQCGSELDLTTRRCPKGHPWPLQYCPRDGAPLHPQ